MVGSFLFFGMYANSKESPTETPIVMGVVSHCQTCVNLKIILKRAAKLPDNNLE